MGKLIHLDERRDSWKEVLTLDSRSSSLQVYVNQQTGETELVQSNDDGEALRAVLTQEDAALLSAALALKAKKTK